MRWFTREWQNGQLTDAEADARGPAYAAYVNSVADRLPPHLLEFALPQGVDMSVHDALVDRAEIYPISRHIRLRLVNGDLQSGYGKLDLDCIDAELLDPDVDRLQALLENPKTEFLSQEVELIEGQPPRFEIRFLLWPEGQIAIRCSDLQPSRTAAGEMARSDHRNQVLVQRT